MHRFRSSIWNMGWSLHARFWGRIIFQYFAEDQVKDWVFTVFCVCKTEPGSQIGGLWLQYRIPDSNFLLLKYCICVPYAIFRTSSNQSVSPFNDTRIIPNAVHFCTITRKPFVVRKSMAESISKDVTILNLTKENNSALIFYPFRCDSK